MTAPDILRIFDGKLVVMDNDSGDQPIVVRNYLRNWQAEHNIPDGTPVCVIQRQGLQDVFDESDMLRRWGA